MTHVDDLVAEMTVEEKVAQLGGIFPFNLVGPDFAPSTDTMAAAIPHGIGHISMAPMLGGGPQQMAAKLNAIQRFCMEDTRLGIPAVMHCEMLNGVMYPGAHGFPTAISLAATWRPDLVRQMADVARRQARAVGLHHALSPVLDVARDARWGRVHETYGEDPHLIAAMGTAFVRGMQGDDLTTGIVATAKHFIAYGVTEGALNQATAHFGPRELYEVFALPFEAAIRDAGMASVMNAYNDIDGVPVAANPAILTDLLRGRLGFEGVVVADYGTVTRTRRVHRAADSLAHAGALAVEAGLDIELPALDCYLGLADMIASGDLDERAVDTSVRRVLTQKTALGLFDQPYVDETAASSFFAVSGAEDLERELTDASLVLLENDGTLPLARGTDVAVLGPFADNLRGLFAGYCIAAGEEMNMAMAAGGDTSMEGMGDTAPAVDDLEDGTELTAMFGDVFGSRHEVVPRADVDAAIRALYPEMPTVAAAITTLADGTVATVAGCDWTLPGIDDIPAAVTAAEAADVAICAVGEKTGWVSDATAGEGRDRHELTLPGSQAALVEAVIDTGTPTVIVLVHGRPLDLGDLGERAAAVLDALHPARLGGPAIADALYGVTNPGGRLPFTMPRGAGTAPSYHSARAGSGTDSVRTYVDGPTTGRWAFGHGRSYTTFAYTDLTIDHPDVPADGIVRIGATITNTGDRRGDEVVQLYVRDLVASTARPIQQLGGFVRLSLDPGQSATAEFAFDVRSLAMLDRDDRLVVEPGKVAVWVGGAADDLPLAGSFEVTGELLELEHRVAFTTPVTVA